MRNKILRILSLFLVVCIISCFTACNSNKAQLGIKAAKYKEDAFSSEYSGNGVVCENEYWQLIWNNSKKQVSFKDKINDVVWGQIPTEAETDEKYSKINNALKSPVIVHYYYEDYVDERKSFAFTDSVRDGGVYTNKIKNGLSVTYDFYELEFTVTVDYVLNEKTFSVVVDPKKITDNGSNFVTGVTVLPFISGVENTSNSSWMFLPDGSGSVITPKNIDAMGVEGSAKIYGEDLSVEKYAFESVKQQFTMPVYGVVKGDKGLFTVISSGAEQSSIEWQIGSTEVGFSSIYPFFRIRGYSLIETPNGFGWTSLTHIKKFDDYNVDTVFKADYYSLSKENASLKGMANIYKDYLKSTYNYGKTKQEPALTNLKIIGGMKQPSFVLGIPSTKLFCLTDTKQAETIVNDVTDNIGNNINLNLLGFGKSGVDYGKIGGGYKIASKLGGNKGFSKLIKALNKKGINTYYDFDIISFGESGSGYSIFKDCALLPDGTKSYFEAFDFSSRSKLSGKCNILKRENLKEASLKGAEFAKKYGLSNISFSLLSNVIYSDYSDNDYRVCKNMAKDVTGILKDIKKEKLNVSSSYANDYAAVFSDVISDCPMSSSEYSFSYTSVPFYQMVFGGDKVLYSSSVNLASDENKALMFCVESGMIPSYTVIANYEKELATSQKSFIYGSVYDGIKSKIKDNTKRLSEYLQSIKNAAIEDYEIIDRNVRITRFDNGVYAVVNYGDFDAETKYGTVLARSFITGRD